MTNPYESNLNGGAPHGSPFSNPAGWSAAGAQQPGLQQPGLQQPGLQQPGAPMRPPQAMYGGAATAAPTAFSVNANDQQMLQGRRKVPRTGMIWGIVAFVVSAIPFLNWFTLIPAIYAIQISAASLIQKVPGKGMAITGLILGILSILGSIAWIVGQLFIIPVWLLGLTSS